MESEESSFSEESTKKQEVELTDWETFFELNLAASQEIRRELKISEESFLFIHGQSWVNTRFYLAYQALDEVQKMCIYLGRMKDLLKGETVNPRAELAQRLIYEEITEAEQAKIRRLLELLLTLILFSKTNEIEYYRHFLLLEELVGLISSNMDLKDFYASGSFNIQDSIQRQINWIEQVESELEIKKCWYLKNKTSIINQPQNTTILSSVRQRIKEALPLMSSLEKLLFGYSYKGNFSRSSEHLHYSPLLNSVPYGDLEFKSPKVLGLLGLSIIKRLAMLLGKADLPNVKKIIASLDETDPKEMVFNSTVRDIRVGDFVTVYGDLAEVIEIRGSDYGYKTYKILYLAEKPKPDIMEDWFPAIYVRRIFKKEELINRLMKDMGEDFNKISPEQLNLILRNAVVELWKVSLKDYIKSRLQ